MVVWDSNGAFFLPGVSVPVMEPVRELLRSREIDEAAARVLLTLHREDFSAL